MRFSNYIMVVLFLSCSTTWAQKNTSGNNSQKPRTKKIIVPELSSKLMMWMAINSEQELVQLIDLLDSKFEPGDEEYFSGHLRIAQAYSARLFSVKDALYHIDLAAIALKSNYPFRYNKTPAYITREKASAELILQMGQTYRWAGFPESVINLLEGNKNLLGDMTESTYYSCLAEAYSMVGDNVKAVNILVDNEKSFKQFPFVVYSLVSTFYSNSFQFNEAIPYAIKLDSSLNAIFESFRNSDVPDSDKEYLTPYQKIDRHAFLTFLLIKADRMSEASQFAKGLLDKAYLDYFGKNYAACKQKLSEARSLIDEFSKKVNSSDQVLAVNTLELEHGRRIRQLLIMTEIKLGDFSAANVMIKENIANIEQELEMNFASLSESQRKEIFSKYSNAIKMLDSFLLVYAEQSPDAIFEILDVSLQSKGLILDVTAAQEILLRSSTDATVLKQIAIIQRYRDKQIAFVQQAQTPALADSAYHYSGLINEMQRKLNEKMGVKSIIKRVTWQDLQKILKPEEVFVEIVRIDRDNFLFDRPFPQYWAFVVKPGEGKKPEAILIGEGNAFEDRLFKSYQNHIRSQLEDGSSYDVFWKKIAAVTTGSKRIYLSSDGLFQIMNPLTLFNPTSKKYLLDEIGLVRVATGRDLLNRKTSGEFLNSITLVGNPDFSMSRKSSSNLHPLKEINLTEMSLGGGTRSGFAVLPGTQKETDIIANLSSTSGLRVELLQNASASENNVKKVNAPSVLHIATHGEFDNRKTFDAYLKSKLILAGAGDTDEFSFLDYGKYEDGSLLAYEVTQMNLTNTKLVVLSACETGLGEVQSGEGVWGLLRAFQLAGSQNVMGSLWKISDEATVTFMEAFYKSYLSGTSASDAYQAAMNDTKTKYPHPYYWGAFILNEN